MKTLKIKTLLHKHDKDITLYRGDKYITNGEFLMNLKEVNLPSLKPSYNTTLDNHASTLIQGLKLTEIKPIVNEANCIILDVHSFITSVYTDMLKSFMQDKEYTFFTFTLPQKVTPSVTVNSKNIAVYRGIEFVCCVMATVCNNTKTCALCNGNKDKLVLPKSFEKQFM